MIYLDNAATTFPKPDYVYEKMDQFNRTSAVNAGRGSYGLAQEASAVVNDTKNRLRAIMHLDVDVPIVFSPSITIALNQIINGLQYRDRANIYVSPYEHNAVARCVELLRQKIGFTVKLIPIRDDYQIDLEKMQYEFSVDPPSILIINAVSNVTGYVLPVEQMSKMAKQFNGTVVIDTAQAAGLIHIDMKVLQADVICFAGHKSLGGPFGIGGFLLRNGIELVQQFAGGTGSDSLNLNMPKAIPDRYEASSPNIVAIAGLLAALKEINVQKHHDKIVALTQYAITKIQSLPNVKIVGSTPQQLGIVSFILQGYNSNDVGDILDNEFDIAVRTGYHCCPYIHSILKDEPYGGTVRLGLGPFNSENDIDALYESLRTL